MNEKEILLEYSTFINDYRQKVNETDNYFKSHTCYPPKAMVSEHGLQVLTDMLDLYLDKTTPKVVTDKVKAFANSAEKVDV
jgi:hypothetical protein